MNWPKINSKYLSWHVIMSRYHVTYKSFLQYKRTQSNKLFDFMTRYWKFNKISRDKPMQLLFHCSTLKLLALCYYYCSLIPYPPHSDKSSSTSKSTIHIFLLLCGGFSSVIFMFILSCVESSGYPGKPPTAPIWYRQFWLVTRQNLAAEMPLSLRSNTANTSEFTRSRIHQNAEKTSGICWKSHVADGFVRIDDAVVYIDRLKVISHESADIIIWTRHYDWLDIILCSSRPRWLVSLWFYYISQRYTWTSLQLINRWYYCVVRTVINYIVQNLDQIFTFHLRVVFSSTSTDSLYYIICSCSATSRVSARNKCASSHYVREQWVNV